MSHGNGPDGKSWERRGHGRSSHASEILRGFGGRGRAERCVFLARSEQVLGKKEGRGAAGRDVVLSKYFSSERSAVLVGDGGGAA